MALSLGIVGLPNVGKSTLFNTLTETASAQASNFPFCTIEPNVGIVPVPDKRMPDLARVAKTDNIIFAKVEFVDIAGLVAGAHKGEGLGNAFLANIRETNAIVQVIRYFEDKNVTHVTGDIDPKDDLETIETELALADLKTVENRKKDIEGKARSGDENAKLTLNVIEKIYGQLSDGKAVRRLNLTDEEIDKIKDLHLLTVKPMIVVANIGEEQIKDFDEEKAAQELDVSEVIPISAKVESELVELAPVERLEFLRDYGLEQSGLEKLIVRGFEILGLQSFYTAGEKEARAWNIKKGYTAPQAAGAIHTDFEKGFIRAEVVAADDFIDSGGWTAAKDRGQVRSEGKDYVMKPDDVVYFHTSK